MIRSNYHTHTFRCNHAIGFDEDYVIEAIGSGINILGFSDHIMLPLVSQPKVRGDFSLLDDYLTSIHNLKNKYNGRIEIKVGFEAEACKEYFPYYKSLLDSKKIDYLILGNHCTFENNKVRFFFPSVVEKENVIEYTDTLIEGMKSGLFSYVAHPDYFMNSYFKWDATAKKCAKRIIEASIEYDVPLEMNLAYFRRGTRKFGKEIRYGYPYIPFWKLVKKYGAKAIIGIDAHAPSDISHPSNEKAIALLEELGITPLDHLDI